ncbi:DUF2793 domain-containing protein [Citreimonas salinaria]|uniref:DUF2793 domain-containing protein n=1 Tax=Citreimonas salinaria TaxID=321339 RepID=A0A1H3N4E9_9RHOB|nr:DUF2793 domain-containing protein [Citreimonas salinaria]SDY83817.1 Protein of unknown function [Citreimonas salinaria]
MSDLSARLGLPFLAPSQAQKHVTHNEALARLDLLVQLALQASGADIPPPAPAAGQIWALGDAPSGAWAGQAGQLAAWDGVAWFFVAPQQGWVALEIATGRLLRFDGAAWVAPVLDLDNLEGVGIGAASDDTNRLSVASDAVLLSHAGSGHQVKVNKAAPGDTASLLFQTGFSGRAEMGTTGDDDFSIKVSDDGSTFHQGFVVEAATGRVRFPNGVYDATVSRRVPSYVPAPVSNLWFSLTSRGSTPRAYSIAAVSGDTVTVSSGAETIFVWPMMGNSMVRVWNTSRVPAESAWVVAVSDQTLSVLDPASVSAWAAGDILSLGDPNPTGASTRGMIALDVSPFLMATFGVVFPQSALSLYTYCSSTDGPCKVGVSPTGGDGTLLDAFASSGGHPGTMAAPIPTPVPSPVSNSNLLFVEERTNTATDIAIGIVRVIGVYT